MNPFAALANAPEDIPLDSSMKKRKDATDKEDLAVEGSKRRKLSHDAAAHVGTPQKSFEEALTSPSGSEKKKKKVHKKKARKAAAASSGDVYAKVFGTGAQPAFILMNEPRHMELKMKDIQNLMLWITTADVPSPPWILVKNKSLIKRSIVVAVNSLQLDLLEAGIEAGLMPTLASQPFAQHRFMKAPGSRDRMYDGVNTLMRHQMSNRQMVLKKKMEQLAAGITPDADSGAVEETDQAAANNEEKPNPENEKEAEAKDDTSMDVNWGDVNTAPAKLQQFLLSKSEMQSNLYPLEDLETYARVSPDSPDTPYEVLAIDCEMCRTAEGLELTKITVLDKNMRVIYDTLVKPERNIVDYNTRYSGITAEMLADVTTQVEDVQERLLRGGIIGPKTVLVGHSLENDLHAMKIYHSKVADTAILFPHTQSEGHKNSLRYLSQRFLNEEIQQGAHDSEVDARAAMKLFLLKVIHGVHFGVSSMGDKQENILEVLSRKHMRTAVVDKSEICRQLAARDSDCFAVFSDDEAVAQTVKLLSQPNHQFIFTHLHAIEKYNTHEESLSMLREQMTAGVTAPKPITAADLSEKQKEILRKLDAHINALWQALPRHCAMLLTGSHGNLAHVRAVIERKQMAFRDTKMAWTEADEAGLEATVDWCRRTRSYFLVKSDSDQQHK